MYISVVPDLVGHIKELPGLPMPIMTTQPLDTADKWDQSCYVNARSIVLQSSAVNNEWTQTKNISVDGNVCVEINTISMIMYIILF